MSTPVDTPRRDDEVCTNARDESTYETMTFGEAQRYTDPNIPYEVGYDYRESGGLRDVIRYDEEGRPIRARGPILFRRGACVIERGRRSAPVILPRREIFRYRPPIVRSAPTEETPPIVRSAPTEETPPPTFTIPRAPKSYFWLPAIIFGIVGITAPPAVALYRKWKT